MPPPILAQPPGVPQIIQLRAHPVLAARDTEVAGRRVNSSSRCTGPNHRRCVVGESGKPSERRGQVGKALQAEEAACADA